MSADKRKSEPRASKLLIGLTRWGAEVGRLIHSTVPRAYLRLASLGMVKIERRRGGLGAKRYTYAVLTETGRRYVEIIQGAPKKAPPLPHKRSPRVEKKARPRDRRATQED